MLWGWAIWRSCRLSQLPILNFSILCLHIIFFKPKVCDPCCLQFLQGTQLWVATAARSFWDTSFYYRLCLFFFFFRGMGLQCVCMDITCPIFCWCHGAFISLQNSTLNVHDVTGVLHVFVSGRVCAVFSLETISPVLMGRKNSLWTCCRTWQPVAPIIPQH